MLRQTALDESGHPACVCIVCLPGGRRCGWRHGDKSRVSFRQACVKFFGAALHACAKRLSRRCSIWKGRQVKLQFLGATRQVTGSQYYLEANSVRLLIDCGMYQERDYLARNWDPSPVPLRRLDAVLLTHAHLDHCGLAPKLVREGLRCPIYCTRATADLAAVVLDDAAEIQVEDAAYKRKRHRREGRKGKYPEIPLFAQKEVRATLPLLRRVAYGRELRLGRTLAAVFHDAGHILGSAMIELRFGSQDDARRLIFSGDIGRPNRALVRDPTTFTAADYVVMESTYGNRQHEQAGSIAEQLAAIVRRTVKSGGKVIVPVFAIERAQEVIYHLHRLLLAEKIPRVPVFLDSPMAAEVNEVFQRHREDYDREAQTMMANGSMPLELPGLEVVQSAEQSKALNRRDEPMIIMAGSGMCTAGRIKHHLAQYISRPECTVLFVGYQAAGTLGRQILDGRPEVRIHGRMHPVRARIEQIHGFSGHADRGELIAWLENIQQPRRVFLTHGEEEESLSLARHLRDELGLRVTVPEYRQSVELD